MLARVEHLTADQLTAGLDEIRAAPADVGRIVRIVRRPTRDAREQLSEASLDPDYGLLGDSWLMRTGGTPTPRQREAQLTLMNARCTALVARDPDRWQLAGDQLYVDMDISHANLPAGAHVALGSAVLQISSIPHTGCRKFAARFGDAALEFVNSEEGQSLRLRGVNARVVLGGIVRVGDSVQRVLAPVETATR
jgi:hypothetical protein